MQLLKEALIATYGAFVCARSVPMTVCEEEKQVALEPLSQGPHIPDFSVPECMPDGTYPKIRCNFTGDCWCQNTHTGKQEGEYFQAGTNSANQCEPVKTRCQEEQQSGIDQLLYIPIYLFRLIYSDLYLDYIPPCTPDGSYPKMRCGLTGDCWCQNPKTGEREGEYF
jgi:hypothetical protein